MSSSFLYTRLLSESGYLWILDHVTNECSAEKLNTQVNHKGFFQNSILQYYIYTRLMAW